MIIVNGVQVNMLCKMMKLNKKENRQILKNMVLEMFSHLNMVRKN